MAQVHPALRGKSQDEIDRIYDGLVDGLNKAFHGQNNWMSSREQNEAVEKVAHQMEEGYTYLDFIPLMKAVAQDDKATAWDILNEMATCCIESIADLAVYPSNGKVKEWLK